MGVFDQHSTGCCLHRYISEKRGPGNQPRLPGDDRRLRDAAILRASSLSAAKKSDAIRLPS
ncbi:hypothetical protein BRPE64_ACDS12390 [Caballeronia insecticola]|uniref:Uncharacterized protein n=1 Tax=Caballeronia insecticola TaxID=758793 RepID=R4WGF8_9BURK|nr:hypothetical protein BRPE64_ACDS12390 [Caballeronia insecticola]